MAGGEAISPDYGRGGRRDVTESLSAKSASPKTGWDRCDTTNAGPGECGVGRLQSRALGACDGLKFYPRKKRTLLFDFGVAHGACVTSNEGAESSD